jgi:hypothetical protein
MLHAQDLTIVLFLDNQEGLLLVKECQYMPRMQDNFCYVK